MLLKLLADPAIEGGETNAAGGDIVSYIFVGILLVALVVIMIFNSRRNKKQAEESAKILNAVKVGNKVKTIGGICGIVVEIDQEENTFVLETGSEALGKSYVKFDRQAIYQTDAEISDESKAVENNTVESNAEVEASVEVEEIVEVEEPVVETDKTEE